jgi:transposase
MAAWPHGRMAKVRLADGQWTFIPPLLPLSVRIGQAQADDRRTVEDILYVLITGCRWQELPREYGVLTTI